jgi:hypothetical protein
MKWEDETKSCQLKGERMNVVLKVLKLPQNFTKTTHTYSASCHYPLFSVDRVDVFFPVLSGGLPTLYYATLQLHNNAGKDIELIESEGKETAHLITKGEIRKIKLIGHETKHYKFEAIDNSTGEPLVLNNQAFASVTLGDDPDRIMDVTISKPSTDKIIPSFLSIFYP